MTITEEMVEAAARSLCAYKERPCPGEKACGDCEAPARRALTAALSTLPPAPDREWQPIETAPTDGTRVDLWCSPPLGHAGRVSDCWFSIGKWWCDDAFGEDGRSEVANATQWIPTPSNPTLKSAPDFSFTHDSLNRYLDKVREAWEAARSSPPDRNAVIEEWQPIETAPKDGTVILICTSEQCDMCGSPMTTARWDGFWKIGTALRPTMALKFNHEPSHWMPLPELPPPPHHPRPQNKSR